MDESYNEYGFNAERLADEELFSKEVVGEDNDLILVDCLLREALNQKVKTKGAQFGALYFIYYIPYSYSSKNLNRNDPDSRTVGQRHLPIDDPGPVESVVRNQQIAVQVGPVHHRRQLAAAVIAQEVSVIHPIISFIPNALANTAIL